MPNVALQRIVEERVQNVEAATDGDVIHYTGNRGFTSFDWPGTLTVDLASTYTIRCIRTLLWDGLGEPNRTRDPRFYLYRLLVSVDHNQWKVLFDTGNNGSNGWQVFNFPDGLQARYVRIHGLFNSKSTTKIPFPSPPRLSYNESYLPSHWMRRPEMLYP